MSINRDQWAKHCEKKRKDSYVEAEPVDELAQAAVEVFNLDGHEAQVLLQMVAGKIEEAQKDVDGLGEAILHCPLDIANKYLTTMRELKHKMDALHWVLELPKEIRKAEKDALHEQA